MQIRSPNIGKNIKLRICKKEKNSFGNLGGFPPSNVDCKNDGLRYFLTVPFTKDGLQLSVFVAKHERLIEKTGEICPPGLVKFFLHCKSEGIINSRHSELSEHGICLVGERDDMQIDEGEEVVCSGHKYGGKPYFIRTNSKLKEDLIALERNGFVHFLQIDFPDFEDEVVSGGWPFGDGIFHVWCASPFFPENFRWQWDF